MTPATSGIDDALARHFLSIKILSETGNLSERAYLGLILNCRVVFGQDDVDLMMAGLVPQCDTVEFVVTLCDALEELRPQPDWSSSRGWPIDGQRCVATAHERQQPLTEQAKADLKENIQRMALELERGDLYWAEYDFFPFAHHPIWVYWLALQKGRDRDPDFEALPPSRAFGLKSPNLAMLLLRAADYLGVHVDRAIWLYDPATPGADPSLSVQLEKLSRYRDIPFEGEAMMLAALVASADFYEEQAKFNGLTVQPHFNTVRWVCQFCDDIKNLANLSGHSAVEATSETVDEDVGWQRKH